MVRRARRQALHDALDDLERYARDIPLDRFLADRDAQRQVLQAMYVATQACLDEAIAVCQVSKIDAPETYRDAFLALARNELLESALASRLADWAAFRNVLAHFYPILDLRRAHQALGDLADLRSFEAWLSARPE
jgi:uncharacterized protein YutE (UPF0331/DUF86 family)